MIIMLINLDELNYQKDINIDYEVLKDNELDKRILDLKNAYVKGKISQNSNGDITLKVNFKGTMYISDSITLESIPYDFNIDIEENIDDLEENYFDCYKNKQNVLDLKQILWQNIVLEVPISYTLTRDANLKGNGWELVNDNNKAKDTNNVDPRLKELEDLLKGDD